MLRRVLFAPILRRLAPSIAIVCLLPATALAVQEHAAPEGFYAHQLGHLFFIASLGLLIFWLRQRKLVAQTGWRYIQYGAVFFILWNLDAFTAHLLDEHLAWVDIQKVTPLTVRLNLEKGSQFWLWIYYAAKLDHLLCVPALLFLYAGLRRLLSDAMARSPEAEAS